MPEKILVTGGAGFIGGSSVELLLKENYQVVVLDNLSSGKVTNLDLNHPNLEFIEGDVLEYPLLLDLLADCDAVLHLAAIPSVVLSLQEPIYSFQVNVQGFLHVLAAIHALKRSIGLVYASSAAVYGNTQSLPCRDDVPLAQPPLSPYALHKINNEQYAFLYEQLYGIKSIGLRYFNVYGKGQDPTSVYSGVISIFLNAYREHQPLTIYGDGSQTRDFIHVEDIARANLLALQQSDKVNGVMNIATGKQETLLQLINYIEAAGKEAKPTINIAKARAGDILHSYGACETAKATLGFEYQISLQDGIARFF